jgi:phosphoribosylformylglycinamidine synthase subunit PurQ / glutaminase
MQFVCKNVFIKSDEGGVIKIPIAHGEGRYYADEETLKNLHSEKQIIYRYCNDAGDIDEGFNPNGSTQNIAGICNEQRNVFGMMPHPERACSTALDNIDGKKVFKELFSIN